MMHGDAMPILILADNAPPPPAADPRLHALHAYWTAIRGMRRFPGRSDFDPIDIPALLAFVSLVEVRTGKPRFVYRVMGTKLAELLRRDVTGQAVGTGVKPEELESVLARYHRVADDGVAIYHRDRLQEEANDYTDIDRLMLPMGDRDDRVELILSIVVRADKDISERYPRDGARPRRA